MSNKKVGEDFEKELLNILKENGFWATKLKEKETGGPFDIVATKNNTFFSIEAKNIIKGTKFPKSRVEPNQIMAFKRLFEVGSDKYDYFAFKTEIGVFLLHSSEVLKNGDKNIDVSIGISLEEWLKQFKN